MILKKIIYEKVNSANKKFLFRFRKNISSVHLTKKKKAINRNQ